MWYEKSEYILRTFMNARYGLVARVLNYHCPVLSLLGTTIDLRFGENRLTNTDGCLC